MALGALAVPGAATAQKLVTAEVFFEGVARTYAAIEDYQAEVVIATRRFEPVADDAGESEGAEPAPALQEVELSRMEGALSFKRPDLLRIDFTKPDGGVLVSDGKLLTIYLPELDLIIEQQLDDPASTTDTLAIPTDLIPTPGLSFLRANYAIAYEVGPDPVLLGDGSGEQVVRLVLEPQVPEEGFERIEVAVGDDKLIHSIVGEYSSGDRMAVEFRAARIDRSIPDARFHYESPPDANVYHDVLFGPPE